MRQKTGGGLGQNHGVKARLLLACILVSLLCGCASNNPNAETMIDTSTHTKETVRPEAPPAPALIGPP